MLSQGVDAIREWSCTGPLGTTLCLLVPPKGATTCLVTCWSGKGGSKLNDQPYEMSVSPNSLTRDTLGEERFLGGQGLCFSSFPIAR